MTADSIFDAATTIAAIVHSADMMDTFFDEEWDCGLVIMAFKTKTAKNILQFESEAEMKEQVAAEVDSILKEREHAPEYKEKLVSRAMKLLQRTMVITRLGLRNLLGLTCAAALESRLGFLWYDGDREAAVQSNLPNYNAKELRVMCKANELKTSGTKAELLER